jgi:hypothetical protein
VARTRISEKPGFGKERSRRQRFVQPASNATLIRWTGHQFISMRTNPGLTSSVVCWVAVALIVCFASAERRRLWHQHRRCTGDENSHLILPSGKTTGADEPGKELCESFQRERVPLAAGDAQRDDAALETVVARTRSPMVRWESNETPPCRLNCKRLADWARISGGCEYLVGRKSAGYSLEM